MGQETQPSAGDEAVASTQDTNSTATQATGLAIRTEPEANSAPSWRATPERAAASNDANLEPEWALPAPGFIPMPEPDPFAEGFADDDGFGTPGPSPQDLAAEARRASYLRRRR